MRTIGSPTSTPIVSVAARTNIEFSLSLDGVAEHIQWTDYAPVNFTRTTAFSICAWVKVDGNLPSIDGTIISKLNTNPSTNPGYWLYIPSQGFTEFRFQASGSNSLVKYSVLDPTTNQWSFITVTYDGSGLASGVHFYLNGVHDDGALDISDTLSTGTTTNTNPLRTGAISGGSFFPGKLGPQAIFSGVLTQSQVNALYNNGVATDFRSVANALFYYSCFGGASTTAVFDETGGAGTPQSMEIGDFDTADTP